MISPSGDIDNYKFIITTGGTITITLTTLPFDYDIKLLNSAGTQVAISQAGGTTSETINYTAAAGTYYAQVYGYNGANSSTNCYTLKVQLGTATRGTEMVSTQKVKVFPNPVSDKVNIWIEQLNATAEVKLFDIYGKLVMQKQTAQANTQLNMSSLPAGIYLVKILSNGTETVMKIVKE